MGKQAGERISEWRSHWLSTRRVSAQKKNTKKTRQATYLKRDALNWDRIRIRTDLIENENGNGNVEGRW